MRLVCVFLAALCCIFGDACGMHKIAGGLAWEAASRAGDYIYDHREDIADAVDRGDYFDAAMTYEGSGRDHGDGCAIM